MPLRNVSGHSLLVGPLLGAVVLAGCRSEPLTLASELGRISAAVGVAAGRMTPSKAPSGEAPMPEAETDAEPAKPDPRDPPPGYVAVTATARSGASFGHAVLLLDPASQTVVPIFVGGTEALSIQLRLDKQRFVRPLTHDLLDDVMKRLGGKLVRSQVDALVGNTYTGTIVIDKGGEILAVDARPSDAIALALGNRVPIYVSEKLMKSVGVRIDELDEPKQGHPNPVAL